MEARNGEAEPSLKLRGLSPEAGRHGGSAAVRAARGPLTGRAGRHTALSTLPRRAQG